MGRLTTSTVKTAAGDAVTRFGYDPAGLLTSVTQPDDSVLYYTYDAAAARRDVSDPAGESITYTLDGMGNIIKQDIRNSSGTIVETQSQVFNQLNRTGAIRRRACDGSHQLYLRRRRQRHFDH